METAVCQVSRFIPFNISTVFPAVQWWSDVKQLLEEDVFITYHITAQNV